MFEFILKLYILGYIPFIPLLLIYGIGRPSSLLTTLRWFRDLFSSFLKLFFSLVKLVFALSIPIPIFVWYWLFMVVSHGLNSSKVKEIDDMITSRE